MGVQRLLGQQEYPRQGRRAKGLLRAYVAKMTGMSRAQVTRLDRTLCADGTGGRASGAAASFSTALHRGRRRTAGRGRSGA